MTRRRWRALVCLVAVVGVGGCRAGLERRGGDTAPAASQQVARGAVLYAAYCGGCHGFDGRGDGPVARTLNLAPTDLRAPRLLADVSDAELIDRIKNGTPLATRPTRSAFAEERQLVALTTYVGALSSHDWPRARAGRIVYDRACGTCHGAYGTGEGVIGGLLKRPPANLQTAAVRYTDPALAAVVRQGAGTMPPMGDMLDPSEVRAVVAYVRLLSPGYRVYDTYCAGCHGDDGRGVHPEDRLAPAVAAPAIDPASLGALTEAERRARILHMFRREQGLMPHFRDILSDQELGDVVAFLRSRIAQR
jgi:mono/diheme cytochrome c family protein